MAAMSIWMVKSKLACCSVALLLWAGAAAANRLLDPPLPARLVKPVSVRDGGLQCTASAGAALLIVSEVTTPRDASQSGQRKKYWLVKFTDGACRGATTSLAEELVEVLR